MNLFILYQGAAVLVALLLMLKAYLFIKANVVANRTSYVKEDFQGRCILVTGGTSGIGLYVVCRLLKLGCKVIVGGRSWSRLRQVFGKDAQRLGKTGTIASALCVAKIDLSSLASVAKFVQSLVTCRLSVDCLINNAAYMGESHLSQDGYELTFAINYLSHFFLTQKLIETDILSSTGLCICVSSNYYKSVSVTMEEILMLPYRKWKKLEFFESYKTTKFLLVAATNAFAKRHPSRKFLALHPGELRTGILRSAPGVIGCLLRLPFTFLLPSADFGAQLIVYAASQGMNCNGIPSGSFLENGIAGEVVGEAADKLVQDTLFGLSKCLLYNVQMQYFKL